MKSEKGISLISLIIYLIAFTTTVAIVANVSNYFYKNLTQSGNSLKTNEQLLKLNSYLTKEINIRGNVIESIGEEQVSSTQKMNYIIFANTQNQYSFINGEIYFNKTKICSDINTCNFEYNNDVLTVRITVNGNNTFVNSYKILTN